MPPLDAPSTASAPLADDGGSVADSFDAARDGVCFAADALEMKAEGGSASCDVLDLFMDEFSAAEMHNILVDLDSTIEHAVE